MSSSFTTTNLRVGAAAVKDEHCLSCSRLVKNLRTQKTGLVPPTVLQSATEGLDLYSNSGTAHQSQQKDITDIITQSRLLVTIKGVLDYDLTSVSVMLLSRNVSH